MASFLRWLPLALVVVAALWLRTHDLVRRPMHADEANQAVKTGELLETGRYVFDPRDHHGPTLYYLTLPIALARGEHNLAQLNETTVRLVPALAGTLAVALLYFLGVPLGHWTALCAAAFLAFSPPAVYYSRYYIQETLLLAFTLAAFIAARRWWQARTLSAALALGVSVGLMQATKSTAPLFLLAGGLALVGLPLVGGRRDFHVGRATAGGARQPYNNPRGGRKSALPHLLVALAACLLTAVLFYSSFFTHPRGLLDAFTTYAHTFTRLDTDTGHEKPWWYFLRLFAWHREGGLLWHQLPFTALALTGLVLTCANRIREPLLRWAGAYTSLVLLLLSFPAYKTPWHAVHLVPGLAVLAAGALAAIARLPTGKFVAAPATFLVAATLYQQTALAAFHRPGDARNPYAYVHTSPDILKIRALAEAALARSPNLPIRIIADEYWPLPWYLRGLPRIGYWATPPPECDGALIIASANHADAVRSRLRNRYTESILGLRPGVLLVIFTPDEGTTNGHQ